MGDKPAMRFELNVLNLFNQKTARHIFDQLNRGATAVGQLAAQPGERGPGARVRLQRAAGRDA